MKKKTRILDEDLLDDIENSTRGSKVFWWNFISFDCIVRSTVISSDINVGSIASNASEVRQT